MRRTLVVSIYQGDTCTFVVDRAEVQRSGEAGCSMTKNNVPPTYQPYQAQSRTSQHPRPMLPSQSPFIPRHLPPGCCTSLPPSAAVPPHFHYAPVHHHPQQGPYAGGGQSGEGRCAGKQCDVTSMPPPAVPSTVSDSIVELNAFQLMASTSYPHR